MDAVAVAGCWLLLLLAAAASAVFTAIAADTAVRAAEYCSNCMHELPVQGCACATLALLELMLPLPVQWMALRCVTVP
jgi:hypothetical protein